ncbi:hypothetical protein [Tianweitania sediminis]|uniref:Uncharacterized protein n=1 Tax=Tianweitania sediminis TaxID=1502156 RepID=A0A8J7R2Y3_9HYPH|nr:hypothetical protein [Tianweitania sediminis]MBP0440672.1 hypothetical protein [Tianweitania sediminis]
MMLVTNRACNVLETVDITAQTNVGCSDCGLPIINGRNTRRALGDEIVAPRLGEAMSLDKKRTHRLTEEEREGILRMYRTGEKISVIAATYGVPTNYPRTLAVRRNVTRGVAARIVRRADPVQARSETAAPVVPVAEIQRLSAKGLGCTQIAALLRCRYRDVADVLDLV